jgi:hypothetical protein
MANFTITNIGALPQWVISVQGQFVQESATLTLALAYLATILNFGDTIYYVDEPVIPAIP